MPDDTQDVPQGVLTGVLLAGERAEEESVQKPGRTAAGAALSSRIIALEGGGSLLGASPWQAEANASPQADRGVQSQVLPPLAKAPFPAPFG